MREIASSLHQYSHELKISVWLHKLLWTLELDLTIPVLYSFVINFPLPSVCFCAFEIFYWEIFKLHFGYAFIIG